MFCLKCGKQNKENAKFCVGCGQKFSPPAAEKKETPVEKIEKLETRLKEIEVQKPMAAPVSLRKKKIISWVVVLVLFVAVGAARELQLFYPETWKDIKEKIVSVFSNKEEKAAKEKEKRLASYKTFSLSDKTFFKHPPDWIITKSEEYEGMKAALLQKGEDVWFMVEPIPTDDRNLAQIREDIKEDMVSDPALNLKIISDESNEKGFKIEFTFDYTNPDDPLGFFGVGGTEEGTEATPEKIIAGHGLIQLVRAEGEKAIGFIVVTPQEKWSQYQEQINEVIGSVNSGQPVSQGSPSPSPQGVITKDTAQMVLTQSVVGSDLRTISSSYMDYIEPEISQGWQEGYSIEFRSTDEIKRIQSTALRYSDNETANAAYNYAKDYLPQVIAGSTDEDIGSIVLEPLSIGDIGDVSSVVKGAGSNSERIVYVCFFRKQNIVSIVLIGSRDINVWPASEGDLYYLSKIVEGKIIE